MEDDEWELQADDLRAMGLLNEGQAEALEEELFPDIHGLFRHYNATYFQSKLEFCSVEWSTGRMTLCAGICMFSRDGGCRIKLSEPLLKYRPVKDLKETLLHEMIHAYQFLVDRGEPGGVRDDHGPRFKSLMHAINTSTVPDCHRPPEGYNIDTHHTMIDEVNLYRTHWWQCDRCNRIVKRAMNRRPQPADCRGRQGKGDACQDQHCLYHMHIKACGGNYVKIKGPDLDKAAAAGVEGKAKAAKAAGRPGGGKRPAAGGEVRGGKKAGGAAGGAGAQPITHWFKPAANSSPSQGTAPAGSGSQPGSASAPGPLKQEPQAGLLPVTGPHALEGGSQQAQSAVQQTHQQQAEQPELVQEDAAQRRQRCLQAAVARFGTGAAEADAPAPAALHTQLPLPPASQHPIEGLVQQPSVPVALHSSKVTQNKERCGSHSQSQPLSQSSGRIPSMVQAADLQGPQGRPHRTRVPGQNAGQTVEVVELSDDSDDEPSASVPMLAAFGKAQPAAAAGGATETVHSTHVTATPGVLSCPVCCESWPVGSLTNEELNRHLDACLA